MDLLDMPETPKYLLAIATVLVGVTYLILELASAFKLSMQKTPMVIALTVSLLVITISLIRSLDCVED